MQKPWTAQECNVEAARCEQLAEGMPADLGRAMMRDIAARWRAIGEKTDRSSGGAPPFAEGGTPSGSL